MATHDYSIANQSFPATRSDINNALAAIQSSNSAATAPSGTGSTVAGELFYNTTSNKLQIATDANGTFVDVALDSSGNQTVTGTLGVTGVATFTAEAVFNGGLALGDSDKVTFGAGDDLEIYHDGSNSIIKDNGTGNIRIQTTGTLQIGDEAYNEAFATFNDDGAVTLYYDNAEKVSTTADGIKVGDATTLDSEGTWDAIQLGAMAWLAGYATGGDSTSLELCGNGYLNNSGDWTYAATEEASKISQVDGSIRFNAAASGTAGTSITWTEIARMETDGDFHAEGDVIAYSTTVSDERLKTGIHTIQDALDKVYSLKGVEFTYKADGKRSAGLIAQDVEKVLPSAVTEKELPLKVDDGNMYKTLQYDQTIGLLVEAVKELKDLVDEQAQEIELLKKG